ncbi:MAG: hypothetical protein D6732_21110, partial [Methanobacteriota archaeon]
MFLVIFLRETESREPWFHDDSSCNAIEGARGFLAIPFFIIILKMGKHYDRKIFQSITSRQNYDPKRSISNYDTNPPTAIGGGGIKPMIVGGNDAIDDGALFVPASSNAVQAAMKCATPEMKFLRCPEMKALLPEDNEFKGTTVFIDSGLTANDWYRLELGGWVDIVQYRTKVGD